MTWRLAKSLTVLLKEANTVAPERAKGYDGTIGDAAHAARTSRHNPNAAGVVTALDITHDPAHGMDTYSLFEYLRTHPHKDLAYIISNRRVASRAYGWAVRPYTGSNDHDRHIHIAAGSGPDSAPQPPYDDTDPWGLSQWATPPTEEDDMAVSTVDPVAAVRAEKALAEAGIINKPGVRKPDDAVSWGLVCVLLERVLSAK